MTVCARAWEVTWTTPTSPINITDRLNQGETANAAMIMPYRVMPTNMTMILGTRSPKDAINTELNKAPMPMALNNSPCPVAPTWRISRANTGKSVMNGMMNIDEQMTINRLERTASLRQLNFQPSMMLRPKDSSWPCLPSVLAEAPWWERNWM